LKKKIVIVKDFFFRFGKKMGKTNWWWSWVVTSADKSSQKNKNKKKNKKKNSCTECISMKTRRFGTLMSKSFVT
jgi:hypothetical protein